MPLKLLQLAEIERKDPRLGETLRSVVNEINLIAQKAGASGTNTAPPPTIAGITVQPNAGNHEIVINDPVGQSQPSLGIHYFADWDTNPAFNNPHTIVMGPSRNAFVNLGSHTVYWRGYSQLRNSPRSDFMVHGGSTPIAVNAAGSPATTPLPSQGSGGSGGGGGFGGG